MCFIKVITHTNAEGVENVIALHITGPDAGEILQGYAVAISAGITKEAFDNCIQIHPTFAEDIIGLKNKKGVKVKGFSSGGCG